MKKFFSSALIFAACISAFSLASCSDDNGGEGGGSVNIENPNTGETPSTPVEQKQYMEKTAVELKDALNPADQADFVEFCRDFANEFSAFNAPVRKTTTGYVNLGIKHMGQAVAKGNALGITRAMMEFSYSFSDITGIYEPDFNREEWVRTGDSDKVEFRFTVNGQACSLVVEGTGGTWSAQAQGYEYDEYEDEDIPALYKITVPRNVKVTLTEGSEVLAHGTVVSNYDQKGHKANADVDATVANINVKATADITDSRAIAHARITVGGKEIADVNGQLNGHDLCNYERLLNIWLAYDDQGDYDYDPEDESWITNPKNIHSLFSNATANTNILRRMFVAGRCDQMARLAFTFSNWYDYEEDKAAAHKQLDFINGHINASFYLGGSKEPTGDIVWMLYKDSEDYYDYEYWYPEPVLKFNADGTTYRFSEYFNENDFSSTIDVFVGIADLYKTFFGF